MTAAPATSPVKPEEIRAASQGAFAGSDIASDERRLAGCSAKGRSEPGEAGVRGSIPRLSTINPDIMIYFVLVRYKSGLAWAERDPANMSRRDTIADIMTGDLENIVTILECNPVEHLCSDVTEDVLAEAGVFVTDEAPLTGQDKIEWLNDHRRDHRKQERV